MAEKKSIIETVVDGFAESTRNVHEINKENLAAVKADTKANFDEATTPDPDFVKFTEAKGLGAKAKVVVENIKAGAAEAGVKEREYRAEVQSHEAYRVSLEEQRTRRQATIKGKR